MHFESKHLSENFECNRMYSLTILASIAFKINMGYHNLTSIDLHWILMYCVLYQWSTPSLSNNFATDVIMIYFIFSPFHNKNIDSSKRCGLGRFSPCFFFFKMTSSRFSWKYYNLVKPNNEISQKNSLFKNSISIYLFWEDLSIFRIF